MSYQVETIPAFKDNYIWGLRDGGCAAVVDPGDAQPVLEWLARERLRLVAIIITHHHADHIGGIPALLEKFSVPVHGPIGEEIPTLTNRVGGGDAIRVPEIGADFAVIDVPGHTRAHIAYYGAGHLFCGDTLFACGCGRLFEGTPEQMHRSLAQLAALPGDTKVYCAHEYTMSNIAFARAVEPGNAALATREQRDAALRRDGLPTVPSTIAAELATNPFMRASEPEVAASASARVGKSVTDPVEVFAAIRGWKNEF
jgi:hydroxyacylglutathione hydrolase